MSFPLGLIWGTIYPFPRCNQVVRAGRRGNKGSTWLRNSFLLPVHTPLRWRLGSFPLPHKEQEQYNYHGDNLDPQSHPSNSILGLVAMEMSKCYVQT